MKLIKQKRSLNIRNVTQSFKNKTIINKKKHGILFPNTLRCIICGPSNSGKTNVMISLLEDINGLVFENVYIYSKSLHQDKYEYLRQLLKPIQNLGYFEYNDSDNIITPSEARENSVFIFDDVACGKQSIIRDYFCMARHKSIDTFYLCQSYTHIPKHLIRDNTNFLILFKQDDLNLKHIYDDHVNTDMTFKEFKNICSLCWCDKYGFLVLDKDSDINCGRYRKGFHYYISI